MHTWKHPLLGFVLVLVRHSSFTKVGHSFLDIAVNLPSNSITAICTRTHLDYPQYP